MMAHRLCISGCPIVQAPFRGWQGKLRPGDPTPFCDEAGKNGSPALPTAPPAGQAWVTAWVVDTGKHICYAFLSFMRLMQLR
jgi:hypothetical protein